MSPPPRASDHEAAMRRLITPTAQIVAAAVILVTGLGIASIFWKMPNSNSTHALYNKDIIDPELATTALPSRSPALLSPEELAEIALPMLDIVPAAAQHTQQYTQLYPAPASLAGQVPEAADPFPPVMEQGEPMVPQKFEPMRQVTEEKAISIEPVNKDFQPKPASVGTAEKSDEMLATFLFAGNSRIDVDIDTSIEPAPPMDPFPIVSAPTPALQPLRPLQFGNLSHLQPL